MALRMSRHVVHGKHRIAGELFEQAVFHHLFGAAQTFFGGLEDQVERARELQVFRDVSGRSQQHGGVPVVAAGMHDARIAAGIRQAGGFVDGQRVHVGTQAQRFAAIAALELAHHTRAAQATRDLVAPLRELFGHQIASAVFLVAHLGVLVDVAAHRDELIGLRLQGFDHGVGKSFAGGVHGRAFAVYCGCRLIDLAIARNCAVPSA